jgi:tryptophan halogenase
VDEYNEQMKVEILNVRDFIILHYHLTDRNDSPFWQYCRNMDIPKSLEHRMRMFRETGKVFVKSYELFSEASWLQVMVGQGLIPENYHPVANEIPADDLVKFLAEIRTQVNQNLPKMPTHKDYLDFYCKASDWN